jgi:glycosyltransferase involved in cell wall biosynthesis
MRVHIELAHTLDCAKWERDHAAGLVPDRLPYGLHRLAEHGFELSIRQPARHALLRQADRAVRRATSGYELVNALRDRQRRRCDLALCWDERTGVPAALRSRLPGEPPAALGVVWLTDGVRNGRQRRLAARALPRARLVWGYSESQLDLLEHEWGVRASHLRLLRWGIDETFWRVNGGYHSDGLVVSAGNDRHRDHAVLVQAMLQLRDQHPKLRFEIATKDRIELPAPVGRRHASLTHLEMRDLYTRAAVVAVPTVPNHHLAGVTVLLEAMACGRPVVVSDTSGMREYVRHGETGLLVPPRDRDALVAAIDSLVRDPERASEIGRAARRAVEAQFSTRMLASQLAQALRESVA